MTSTGADGLGAVGHGADRLRAADGVDLVDAGERGGGQHRRRHRAGVAVGRHAQHDLADAGDPRRHRGHQHGRRVGAAAARHVHAGPVDRAPTGPDHDAVALVGVSRPELRLVEGLGSTSRAAVERRRPARIGAAASAARPGRRAPGAASSATPSNCSVYASTAASPRVADVGEDGLDGLRRARRRRRRDGAAAAATSVPPRRSSRFKHARGHGPINLGGGGRRASHRVSRRDPRPHRAPAG